MQLRGTRVAAAAVVLLSVTGAPAARAQTSHREPLGNGARIGSVVGFAPVGGEEAIAIGVNLAVGHRVWRVTIEAELDAIGLSERTGTYQPRHGDMFRVGLTGRFDVARIPVGPRSLLILFAETGVGRQRLGWAGEETGSRVDTHVGGGWLLDHRARRVPLLPAVGWLVSWRFTAAEADDAAHMTRALCRNKECAAPPSRSDYDVGLLVTSALMVSW